jgi:hypothetical protein
MKGLLPVIFTYPNGSKADSNSATRDKPICPSCSREMTNATRCVLLSSRSPAGAEPPKKKKKNGEDGKSKEELCCGHVVCGTCADTVVKPGKQCVVCEASIRPDKDMVDLDKEGERLSALSGRDSYSRMGPSYRRRPVDIAKYRQECTMLTTCGRVTGTGFAAAGGAEARKAGVAFI